MRRTFARMMSEWSGTESWERLENILLCEEPPGVPAHRCLLAGKEGKGQRREGLEERKAMRGRTATQQNERKGG